MIGFNDACEIASRHFESNCDSGLFKQAWRSDEGWYFKSFGRNRNKHRRLIFIQKDSVVRDAITTKNAVDVTNQLDERYRA